jgi:hypothetical protein
MKTNKLNLFQRTLLNFKRDSFFDFMQKVFYYLQIKLRRLYYLWYLQDAESRFTRYYKANYWDSKESSSGFCAGLKNTKNIRKYLPNIIEQYKIKSIIDAP